MNRIARALLGVALLPLCVVVTRAAVSLVQSSRPLPGAWLGPEGWAFCAGFLLWQFLYFTLPRPVLSYVLAHELTHLLWGTLMGANVSGIRISGRSGSVTLSKHNWLIALAPYFFPLYTALAVAAYYGLSLFYAVQRYDIWWMALMGLTWAFHVTFTISTLSRGQTDVRECGWLLSWVLIYLLNVVVVSAGVVMVSRATLAQWIAYLSEEALYLTGWLWAIVPLP